MSEYTADLAANDFDLDLSQFVLDQTEVRDLLDLFGQRSGC